MDGVREAISIHTYVYSESATTNERFVTRVTSAKVTRVSVASPKSVGGLCSRPVVVQYAQYELLDVEEVPVCRMANQYGTVESVSTAAQGPWFEPRWLHGVTLYIY